MPHVYRDLYRPEDCGGFLGAGVTPCGPWEANPGPLEKPPELLVPETSSQLPDSVYVPVPSTLPDTFQRD